MLPVTRTRRPVAAAGVLLLAAALPACSGSGPSRSAASRATTPTTGVATTAGPTTSGPATSSTAAPVTTATTAAAPESTTSVAGTAPTTAAPPTAPGTAPANPGSPVDTAIKVYGDCSTASVEPAGLVLACADYGESLSGLKWSTWTAGGATGVGTFVYNDCNPDCASGHTHRVPGMHVALSAPVPGAGRTAVWSKITFSPRPPGGFPSTQALPTRPV